MVHPEDRAAHTRAFAPLLAGEVDAVQVRFRYVTADHVTRWAEVACQPRTRRAGRPLGIAGVMEDITEHHRTRQYEAAEQAVVDVLGAAIDVEDSMPVLLAALCRNLDWDLAELWTLDPEREVLHCTDAWGERRTGLEALEATRDGETFEVGDGLQGQAWARRVPIWASGLRGRPAVPARCGGQGRRRPVCARDADRARGRGARHDHVLLPRAARSRSGPRPAAADDRRAPGAVPRAPPDRARARRAHRRGGRALPGRRRPPARLNGCTRAPAMRTCVRMTSDGSPYARFQRALRIGRLSLVRAAAAELPRVELDDALSICLLISEQDAERFKRAAVRWLARLSLEVPTVRIEDLRAGLIAFEALPENPLGARHALAELCQRHGLARAARALARAAV